MSRVDKIQQELRHQVSLIVQRELNDPRIGFVTITRVSVSPDLRQADIYFTTLEKEKSFEDTVKGLNSAAVFVRRLIGQRVRIKFTPEIRFVYDNSGGENNRIDEIIEKIHNEKEAADGDKGNNKDV